MLKRNKLNNKANLKHDEEIEILDFEEEKYNTKIKLKLPKIKAKNKQKFAIGTIAVLVLSIFTLLIVPGQNIVKTGVKKFLNSIGIYTEEIKSVEIQSDDYNNPGSWHIDKSAEWVGLNKAQVTFDVNSVMKTNENYKDIILVIDISGSMEGDKLQKAINDSKELINYVLSDTNNRVAIITFDSTSTIVSGLSNKKDELLKKLDAIVEAGATNYNAGLQNVDTIMNGYTKESNRDVVTLFLTDGYPNEDTPNQIGTYETIKEKYPYMTINGVQYEMGKEIIDEIKQITDSQWTADQTTLNNVLLDASVSPIAYENFTVTDYIDEKFQINSVNDIKVTTGTVTLGEENGLQRIVWNLGNNSYLTGGNTKMYINLTLKEQYTNTDGFFTTNNKEVIESKLPDEKAKTVNSTNTPVLKGMYEVIYDTNTPDSCTLTSISNEKYFIYENVTQKKNELSCKGYLFKGWEIDEEDEKDITKVNDDIFKMPGHDVTIRATWAKQSIEKSMDGTIYEKQTLYKVFEEEAKDETYVKEYMGSHKDSFTEDASQKVYYWYSYDDTKGTAILDKINVLFAGHCWQMVRTTDTGGVKMIYNGEAENNQCLNTRSTHVGYSSRTTQSMSTSYYYGTSYNYNSTAKSFTLTGTVTTGTIKTGQYTCKQTSATATCTTLYYVDTLDSGTTYNVLPLNTNSHYSQFGKLQYNQEYGSLAYAGYMYNNKYTSEIKRMDLGEMVTTRGNISSSYWYADTVTWDGVWYRLNNPYQASTITDYSNLVGKYTIESSTSTATYPYVNYIVGVEGSTAYYIRMHSGTNWTSYNYAYTYGNSYTDNGNGTYTINNPTTVESKNWYKNYPNVLKKYVCKNATNNTCSDLWYVTYTSNVAMEYVRHANTYKYAKDFEYKIDSSDGIYKYFLSDNNSVSFYDITDSTNTTSLNNAHYTCFNASGKCTEISYIYYLSGPTTLYYINIKDGKSVEDAKNEMLYNNDVNTINSTIKTGVDLWYEKYLLKYSDYLEDTIFCSDRSFDNASTNGWNPNGGNISTEILFDSNLNCSNETDQFSTLNSKAKLKYKVGLMSVRELNILNNPNIRKTGQGYWLGSPYNFSLDSTFEWYNHSDGYLKQENNYFSKGVRPAISLKPDTEYVDGDGSMANPYIVDTDD